MIMLRGIIVVMTVVCGLMGQTAYADGYVIGEEDMLQISVWGNPELSVHVPVRPDGMISMPLAGDVRASGITPQDLKKNLEKELARYVKAPVVSVIVTAINSYKVYILGDGATRFMAQAAPGAAGQTGQITLRRHTTIMQLLAQIGTINEIDLENAYILRSGKKLNVNFEQLVRKGDSSQDAGIEANDVIYLPGGYSNRIRITGAVRTPGLIPYADGMSALDAVLSAGGFTEFANQNNVLILRKEGNSTKSIEVRLKDVINGNASKNVLLKPGDIVTIKTGLF